MKKRIVVSMFAAAMAMSLLAGCGGSKEAAAPAAEETKEEAPAETTEEAPAETTEEAPAADESASGEFTLLDVDESMVDVGAYGTSEDGLELVFTMFTGPDQNKYVSLLTFDNANNTGDVICGTYEAKTEVDEDGDEWTYFDGTDVYTGDSFSLGCCERPDTGEVAFFDENGTVIDGKIISSAETINYMGSAVALLQGADVDGGEAETSDASDVSYVDGFYANNGSEDFMIFFYESADGDVAYINDGTQEAFAEYTVEQQTLDDGTEYLLVTVGATQLGYIENGSEIYLVGEDGSTYAAERLTEDEAEALHSIVTQ